MSKLKFNGVFTILCPIACCVYLFRTTFATNPPYPGTTTVPGKEFMKRIRDVITTVLSFLDTGACRWLDIAADLDFLNLFMGFRGENNIVYYNQDSYKENITILAGKTLFIFYKLSIEIN